MFTHSITQYQKYVRHDSSSRRCRNSNYQTVCPEISTTRLIFIHTLVVSWLIPNTNVLFFRRLELSHYVLFG
jgi:hypothetical protein